MTKKKHYLKHIFFGDFQKFSYMWVWSCFGVKFRDVKPGTEFCLTGTGRIGWGRIGTNLTLTLLRGGRRKYEETVWAYFPLHCIFIHLFYERHIYKKWFLLVVGPLRGGRGPTDQLRKKNLIKHIFIHFRPLIKKIVKKVLKHLGLRCCCHVETLQGHFRSEIP